MKIRASRSRSSSSASALFSWYVMSYGSYNKTYGSLGAIIGFMTGIWISIIVVLGRRQAHAEMERQTVRESTHWAIKATRETWGRGAKMADRAGAAQA